MSKVGDLAIELMELGALVPENKEPDQKDYVVVDTYVGSPYDDTPSIPDDTPSEMNEWLRQGGW